MVPVSEDVVQSSVIPELLIFETLNDRPLYYKGYRGLVSGTLPSETITGSSDLQSILVSIINTVHNY